MELGRRNHVEYTVAARRHEGIFITLAIATTAVLPQKIGFTEAKICLNGSIRPLDRLPVPLNTQRLPEQTSTYGLPDAVAIHGKLCFLSSLISMESISSEWKH